MKNSTKNFLVCIGAALLLTGAVFGSVVVYNDHQEAKRMEELRKAFSPETMRGGKELPKPDYDKDVQDVVKFGQHFEEFGTLESGK
jgi:hypothetical protein